MLFFAFQGWSLHRFPCPWYIRQVFSMCAFYRVRAQRPVKRLQTSARFAFQFHKRHGKTSGTWYIRTVCSTNIFHRFSAVQHMKWASICGLLASLEVIWLLYPSPKKPGFPQPMLFWDHVLLSSKPTIPTLGELPRQFHLTRCVFHFLLLKGTTKLKPMAGTRGHLAKRWTATPAGLFGQHGQRWKIISRMLTPLRAEDVYMSIILVFWGPRKVGGISTCMVFVGPDESQRTSQVLVKKRPLKGAQRNVSYGDMPCSRLLTLSLGLLDVLSSVFSSLVDPFT